MRDTTFFHLRDSLRTLRDTLPELADELGEAKDDSPRWRWWHRLVQSVLPALEFDLPVLLVAICGGGSTGKSTLFNMLAGVPLSQVGFRAGLTSRVLLAGHPSVLGDASQAQALLHRLRQQPEAWQKTTDTTRPGPPLYAQSEQIPPRLLLIDTPDFDTGDEGELVNRQRAEPVLRTAEVIVYVFTNTVYNNLSNTQFMSDVVGGIGGRPTILIYRISRAATDAEALEHCQIVARKLFGLGRGTEFPEQVIGAYRVHESDAVARGENEPNPIPLGRITAGKSLQSLLASLDVGQIKRQVFDADLRAIHSEAADELAHLSSAAQQASLYRAGLEHLMSEHALDALQSFPVGEAVGLTTKLFLETSPSYVRTLRSTGRIVGAPFRGLKYLGRKLGDLAGWSEPTPPAQDLRATLSRDLLLSANALRNRLLDDALIVRVTEDDALYTQATIIQSRTSERSALIIEPLGKGTANVHLPVPATIRGHTQDLLDQNWEEIRTALSTTADSLVGLPHDIEAELKASVASFRTKMNWHQRVRETFFASLSALPPLLGVTYTLLTANPVSGTGIWIQLESVFGLNDLWALISIPASAGLGEQERKQLEQMIRPVFQLWLTRRLETVLKAFEQTVCRPIKLALDALPDEQDPRFGDCEQALNSLGGTK